MGNLPFPGATLRAAGRCQQEIKCVSDGASPTNPGGGSGR
jgi:hypothetical protein